MMLELFRYIRDNSTEEEFKEILMIATQDIKFNRVSFGKVSCKKEVADIVQATYRLVCKKDMLWIKLCTNCGYNTWSLMFGNKCTRCGGKTTCVPSE